MLNWFKKIFAITANEADQTSHGDAALPSVSLSTPQTAPQETTIAATADEQSAPTIDSLTQQLQQSPRDADLLCRLGLLLYQQQRHEEASARLGAALEIKPDLADAHFVLGCIAQDQGDLANAQTQLREALRLQPDFPIATCRLCIVLFQSGHPQEAKVVIEQGLAINPDVIDFHFYLGNLHDSMGEFDLAIAAFQNVLKKQPDSIAALFNLANVCVKVHREAEALSYFSRIIELEPAHADAYNEMGIIHRKFGRNSDAIACFKKALLWHPQFDLAYSNLGTTLQETQQASQAIRSFDHAIAIRPDFAEAYSNLSLVHKSCYDLPLALQAAEQAFRLKPDFVDARWAVTALKIMSLCEFEPDVDRMNSQAIAELDALSAWCREHQIDGSMLAGMNPLFFMAARETNDRPVLARYGEVCAQLMQAWMTRQNIASSAKPKPQRDKIKVGIVSSNLHDHPVWNAIIKGWYAHFDKNEIEIVTFDIGDHKDRHTAYAVANSQQYEDLQGHALPSCVQAIARHDLDVLLYPSVGSVMTVKLASTRLAPLQIATWGHPETSGLPTIDFFASAENFEPAEAQQHYNERLLLLPNVGGTCEPLAISDVAVDFSKLGIRTDVPVLLCPGMPYKYAPENDYLLAEIARGIGQCQLVFFSATPVELSQKLEQRLTKVFADRGLHFADYALFIRWQPRDAFFALMKHASIFLDTIGYSGFTTAMQAAQCGLPIVTREGKFMRGRFSSGILKRMGVTELIAQNGQEYIDIAIRVATDRNCLSQLRQRLQDQSKLVFHDIAPTAALGRFIVEKVNEQAKEQGKPS